MLATAKMVDGATSFSFLVIDVRSSSAVLFRPVPTSLNRSVLAVHRIITCWKQILNVNKTRNMIFAVTYDARVKGKHKVGNWREGRVV